MSKEQETWKLWRELNTGYDRDVVKALADPVAAGFLWFKVRTNFVGLPSDRFPSF